MIIYREIESASPVVSRSNGDDAHGDLFSGEALLGEDSVDDFIVGSVSSDGNYFFIAFILNVVFYELYRVAWMIGQHGVVCQPFIVKYLFDIILKKSKNISTLGLG